MSLSDSYTVVGLSNRFNVSANSIYNWRSKYAKHQQDAFAGKGVKTQTEEQRRISELERALKESELERDILKKAVSIFSKSDKKSTHSL